ncbi:MAG: protein O-GlcNAc transferase, partial [Phycisphaerales bacterium]|nr:protein O-GlcNAc transferase [Phycisphaerales bacterium]
MTIDEPLNTAIAHHQAGRLAQAEQIYRKILRQQPNHPAALYLLGRVAAQTGYLDHAATLLARATIIDPANADCLGVLGEVFEQLNRMDDALAAYRAAVAIRPDWVEVLNNLGHLLLLSGRAGEAIDAYQSALRHRPDLAETHSNLAEAFRSQSRMYESADAARTAIRLRPDMPAAHGNLGNALHALGQYEEAIDCHRAAIRLDPQFIDAWNNLALALAALRRYDEAADAYRAALRITPNPAYGEIMTNLGAMLVAMDRIDEACDAYRDAIRVRPDYVHAHSNLGNALREQGLIDEAIESFRASIRLRPDYVLGHSNLLFALHFHPEVTNEQLLAEHRAWARQHADPLTRPAAAVHANSRDPERRLRIGFISPDLRDHPIGRFMLPLLEHLDRERVEVICYSAAKRADDITRRLRELSAHWRDTIGLPDATVADQIRADAVDVLIDLSLHSAGNALLAFARRPAPVQVTWLGYAGTSGMMAMDFRLTDPHLDPPGSDNNYSERSLRLPRTYWCYAAPPEAPADVAAPPAQSAGHVTFGCLNQFSKVSAPARRAWTRILQSVPNSRLILHALPGRHRERIAAEFAAAGVEPQRIEWIDKLPIADYLATYHRIDIALDPFPYNGGTTTCDALWMGVPVITLAGARATARAGASILSNVTLEELIATNHDDYVRIATDLAADAPRLSQLRETMRQRMRTSPLMDAASFAVDFETVIRRAWRD